MVVGLCLPWERGANNPETYALWDMAALAYKEVVREPVVREADETRG